MRDVRGVVALVTGASSGIGEALARELSARGARVALVARRRDRLEALAGELRAAGGEALALPCDVGVAEQVEATVEEVLGALGEVGLLVNCAGFARHVLFADHPVADIEAMLRTNVMGTVYTIKQLLPSMRRRGRGAIINLSSFAGKLGQADEAAYSASKFAVTGLSASLAQELSPLGIQVLCVHPTLVRTEMFSESVLARMPGRRPAFMEPAEFARRTLTALARGRSEAVIPARMRGPIVLQALFPDWMGRMVGAVKLGGLRRAGIDVT